MSAESLSGIPMLTYTREAVTLRSNEAAKDNNAHLSRSFENKVAPCAM